MLDLRTDLEQFHVAARTDGNISGITQTLQRSERPVKAIRAHLKGKEGRLCGNLVGKRVDFSARTVITGHLNLQLDEVGVPRSIAMNSMFPEQGETLNVIQQSLELTCVQWRPTISRSSRKLSEMLETE